MISDRFRDIVLNEEELAQIDAEVEARNKEVYEGDMPAHNKSVLRRQLMQEYKQAIWANRDYTYGHDEGEPPKGAHW